MCPFALDICDNLHCMLSAGQNQDPVAKMLEGKNDMLYMRGHKKRHRIFKLLHENSKGRAKCGVL